MSSPRRRYSENEKGKGIRADSSTSIDRSSGLKLLDAAIRAHRGAPGDVASLNSDRIEVAGDAEERFGKRLATTTHWRTMGSSTLECRAHGVEFIILRSHQWPSAPLIGFQCVYECFFQQDSKLWFLIPRLITSYCARRNIAMTKLMIRAVRISIALMVMEAEIDMSMSVRIFEELTHTQLRPGGVYAVQMRSGLSILTGHPSRMKLWQRYYFYV
ncbi:unnamed protein product, partial [Brassica rapa]